MTLVKPDSQNTFFWVSLWLLWIGMIFYFSHIPGSAVYYEPPFKLVLERKGAHVLEYAVLLFLSLQVFSLCYVRESLQRIIILAVVFTLTYGVSDELHQFFTPYRGAHFRDVVIDLGGILLVLIPVLIIFYLHKKKT